MRTIKASSALKLELEYIDTHYDSLQSISRQMLAQELIAQQQIDTMLKEAQETSTENETSTVSVTVANTEANLDDADRAYLAFLDDSDFIAAFDTLVQKHEPTHDLINVQDIQKGLQQSVQALN